MHMYIHINAGVLLPAPGTVKGATTTPKNAGAAVGGARTGVGAVRGGKESVEEEKVKKVVGGARKGGGRGGEQSPAARGRAGEMGGLMSDASPMRPGLDVGQSPSVPGPQHGGPGTPANVRGAANAPKTEARAKTQVRIYIHMYVYI